MPIGRTRKGRVLRSCVGSGSVGTLHDACAGKRATEPGLQDWRICQWVKVRGLQMEWQTVVAVGPSSQGSRLPHKANETDGHPVDTFHPHGILHVLRGRLHLPGHRRPGRSTCIIKTDDSMDRHVVGL